MSVKRNSKRKIFAFIMDINFIWHLNSKKYIKIEIHVQIKLKKSF